jgi:hypothetical protein
MKVRNSLRSQVELWLMLVFLTSLGWSFGLILTAMLVSAVGTPPEKIINLVLVGILGGIIISLLSIFVLHDSIQSTGTWMLAATLGWLLGLLSTVYSIQIMPGAAGWIIGGALGGLIYGIVQSYGFKPRFEKGVSWLVLNALGWAIAYGLGYAIPSDLGLDSITSINAPIAQGMLGWVMLGTVAILFIVLSFATSKRGDRGERTQWWP